MAPTYAKPLDIEELEERIKELQFKVERLPTWAKPSEQFEHMEFWAWVKLQPLPVRRDWERRIAKHRADIGVLIRHMGARLLELKQDVSRLH